MHPMALPGTRLVALALILGGCAETTAPPSVPEVERPRFEYRPVPVNRDHALADGFRGEVHPVLDAQARLELTARWSRSLAEQKRKGIKLGIIDNATAPEYAIPEDLVALLTGSSLARERATYGARELSVFLPDQLTEPGQMWKIDPAAVAVFLRQFHEGTSTGFDSYRQPYGRRPGPAGAFGILRATTADHLDVLFRVHAEFVLAEGAVLYTPACFLGRMLVDRRAGTVEYLQLRVPADLAINVNITLTFPLPGAPDQEVTNIVFERVVPMELVGGNAARLEDIAWDSALDLDEAHARLKSAFYKFLDIDWVPLEDALEVAGRKQKPIMVVVLTSPLDDQSC